MTEKFQNPVSISLVTEQFKSLQAETLLRIGEYHKLLFFKMASSGALFSYVLAKDSPSVLGVFLAPLIAVMADFLIINDLCLIGVMGYYIATEIEARYFPQGFETVVATTRFFGSKRSTWLVDWLVVFGSTVVIYVLTAIVLAQHDQLTRSISLWIFGFLLTLLVADFVYSVRILKPTETESEITPPVVDSSVAMT